MRKCLKPNSNTSLHLLGRCPPYGTAGCTSPAKPGIHPYHL
ncbi:hypothetical protein GQ607_016175 [Colletotrichum asianum]|uniref:Uncharacterized protein n=1 Tax=Colletotrichum asianum TaxID=702518 RepID=A0A8H3ZK68_9PEZI|nr:hypothetical protein GQ607_016175 [Colletotrichum asianum]